MEYIGVSRKRKVQFNPRKNGSNSPKIPIRETMLNEMGITIDDPYIDVIYTKDEIIIRKAK